MLKSLQMLCHESVIFLRSASGLTGDGVAQIIQQRLAAFIQRRCDPQHIGRFVPQEIRLHTCGPFDSSGYRFGERTQLALLIRGTQQVDFRDRPIGVEHHFTADPLA